MGVNSEENIIEVRILIVEDSKTSFLEILRQLENHSFKITARRVEWRKDFEAAITFDSFDCIVTDYYLPDFDGIYVLERVKELGLSIPIFLVSEFISDKDNPKMWDLGVTDFLSKSSLYRLPHLLKRELSKFKAEEELTKAYFQLQKAKTESGESQISTDIHQFESLLPIQKNLFEVLFHQSSQAIFILNEEGGILKLNDQALSDFQNEIPSINWTFQDFLFPEQNSEVKQEIQNILYSLRDRRQISRLIPSTSSNGKTKYLDCHFRRLEFLNGTDFLIVVEVKDISEKIQWVSKSAEENRLASLGELARGIAHDLNNLLTPLYAYLGLIENSSVVEDIRQQSILGIKTTLDRMKHLTKQILNYSLSQKDEDVILRLDERIPKILAEINGQRDLTISYEFESTPAYTKISEIHLFQILSNLFQNALFAMLGFVSPKIKISLVGQEITNWENKKDKNWVGFVGMKFWILTFTDFGSGMSDDIKAKIFEPFFSTKDSKGSGLGLSIVKNIMLHYKGNIFVNSEIGIGTSFHLYFPAWQSFQS